MENEGALFIDGWRIAVESNRIACDGVEQKLEPRSMELLAYLARRPGQVVSRAEIEDQVWHGRVVSYEALSGTIAKIRKAFGDTGKEHRIIETIPKSGYRLIAPILHSNPLPAVSSEVVNSTFLSAKKMKTTIGATALVAMVIAITWWQPWIEREQPLSIDRMAFQLPDKPSIAILPFTNMSDDPEQGYFADGMTEDLITDLSKISGLFVIARNSTFAYKNKSVKIHQVAEELGVRYVMEGSVQRVDNQVRINVQLIDAASGGHIWAERYDGYLDDVFSMRDEITRKITTALSVTLVDQQLERRDRVETNHPEAYDALLRGWAHYQLFTPDDLVKAIPYLENAIELDPSFARAHAVLAAVYWGICNNRWEDSAGITYQDCDKKTSQHLAEAMKNPTPLAHRIAARQHEYGQRWDEALIEAERGIALDPNDANGYQAMSALLVNLGRAAEGLEHIKKAIRLDPKNDYLWRLGYAQFHMERYDEAATTMYRATKRNPDFDWNYLLLAAAYGHLGREQEAKHALAAFNDIRTGKLGKKRPFTLADLNHWSIKNEAGLTRLREGMRKAGVPAR
jgi:TolB-like protein/DNA-binding winged helix-turn-helix (wHTH) protein